MRSIAIGLDLQESYFDDKIHEQYHNLRLLSYPAIKTDILRKEGQARAGAHSGEAALISCSTRPSWLRLTVIALDYGTLTLLFQDSVTIFSKPVFSNLLRSYEHQVGGLEVQNPHTQHFQPAAPVVRMPTNGLIVTPFPRAECSYFMTARHYRRECWRPAESLVERHPPFYFAPRCCPARDEDQ